MGIYQKIAPHCEIRRIDSICKPWRNTIDSIDLKRYLFRGGIWALFGKLSTALVGVLIAGLLARLMTPSEVGLYFLSFNLATFFSLFGRAGLENTLLRFIAQANSTLNQDLLYSILKKGLIFSAFTSASAGLLAVIVIPLVSRYIPELGDLVGIAWLVGAWAALLAFQFVSAEIFRGFQDIGKSVLFGGLIAGLITLSILGIAKTLEFSLELEQSLLLVVLALLSSNIVALIYQNRKLGSLSCKETNKISYRVLAIHSWPLLINGFTIFLLAQSDIWILGAYGSGNDLAVYGAASRLVLLSAISLTVANMVIPPLITRMHARDDLVSLEKLLRTVATLAAIPSLATLCAFMIAAAPIMELVFGAYYRNGSTVLVILCAGKVINVLVGSCGYVLIMTGHRKTIMVISLACAVLAIVAGWSLFQTYGLLGLATAYAVASIIQQISMWAAVRVQVGIWTHASFTCLYSPISCNRSVRLFLSGR